MAAVHFRYVPDGSIGFAQPRGYPACGVTSLDRELTSDPAEVTCGRCKHSGLYLAAVA